MQGEYRTRQREMHAWSLFSFNNNIVDWETLLLLFIVLLESEVGDAATKFPPTQLSTMH